MALNRIVLLPSLFAAGGPREGGERQILFLLEGVISANREYLRQNPDTPRLYLSGVRYMKDPRGVEQWELIPSVIENGGADCEDLSSWRCAELREHGIRCRPYITKRRFAKAGPRRMLVEKWSEEVGWEADRVLPIEGPKEPRIIYHVRVIFPKLGLVEDPSLILGMHPTPFEG